MLNHNLHGKATVTCMERTVKIVHDLNRKKNSNWRVDKKFLLCGKIYIATAIEV